MMRTKLIAYASICVAAFTYSGSAFAQEADNGGSGEPQGGSPVIEAPKSASHGSAIADGGGQNANHLAYSIGSGPGTDVGVSESDLESTNSVAATIDGNQTILSGSGNDVSNMSSLEGVSTVGQSALTQNSGNQSAAGAGNALGFVVNQGETNEQTVLNGIPLIAVTVDDITISDADGNKSTERHGTYTETPGENLQAAVGDGVASAAGGGLNSDHTSWTVGAGSGNDVGFDRSRMVSSNLVLASVTSNVTSISAGEGANMVNQASSLLNVTSEGQTAIAQNTGNNSVVGAGNSITFIANFNALDGGSLPDS
ncbi:hypothetical protein [Emcibacter sp.]|uniref:hypothetical protein n=1 Tax=Emcibacter sp. TaxID=1979954 RepID=UPI002AA95EB3|nr:hypothetical protein [Emcibacter sp.]